MFASIVIQIIWLSCIVPCNATYFSGMLVFGHCLDRVLVTSTSVRTVHWHPQLNTLYTDVQWQTSVHRVTRTMTHYLRGYLLLLGGCLWMCLRVCAFVHTYVGAYCLTCRYLSQCIGSHVLFCTGLLNTYYMPPALFVSTTVEVCVIFVLCCLERPSLCCIWSQFHGWMSLECGGCRVLGLSRITLSFKSQRFYWGLPQRQPFWASRANTKLQRHRQHYTFTPSHSGKRMCSASTKSHTTQWWGICVLWKCLPLKMRRREQKWSAAWRGLD